jgi:hypothetical protein
MTGSLSEKSVRVRLSVVYLAVTLLILYWYNYDNSFCLRRDNQSHLLVIVRLALAFTAWDLFASGCGNLAID